MSYESPFTQRPDYLICTCMGVMLSDIEDAFQRGFTTFQELQDEFGVGTGCSSCVAEIEDLIKKNLKNN